MKLYTYKIRRDYGFAPNPFFGVCTLATCKPVIRKGVKIGDWIAGFGGLDTPVPNRIVYLMQVDEKLTFDQYWNDERFQNKKPLFTKKIQYCYGDNVYHHNEGNNEWIQEDSHHSSESGINYKNLKRDTGVNSVAISYKYWYFGRNALVLPDYLESIICHNRGHRVVKENKLIEQLIELISQNYKEGVSGLPFSLRDGHLFQRYKGE